MRLLRPAAVRRADARPAVIIIIACLGMFAILGLILVATLLIGLRRSATTAATSAPRPLEARYSGLLCYSPPEPASLVAVDLAALNADATGRPIADVLVSNWQRVYGTRFAKVPLSAADVESYIETAGLGNPDDEAKLAAQDRRGTLIAIRFKLPIDGGAVLRGLAEGTYEVEGQVAASGDRYHALFRTVKGGPERRGDQDRDVSLYVPDDRTLLIATTRREMEEAMRRAPTRIDLRGRLRDVVHKADGDVMEAAIGPAGARDPRLDEYFVGRTPAGRAAAVRRAGARWFDVRADGVRYHEGFLMPDSAAATAFRDSLAVEFAKGPPANSIALREFVSIAHVTCSKDFVTVEAKVGPATFAKTLKEESAPRGPEKK
jgi:hypothetical protein